MQNAKTPKKNYLLNGFPELWIDGEGLAYEIVEHHMRDVRLGYDKVAVDDAQLGAVLERLAVEAQLIQQAPAPDEKRKKTPVKHAGEACFLDLNCRYCDCDLKRG